MDTLRRLIQISIHVITYPDSPASFVPSSFRALWLSHVYHRWDCFSTLASTFWEIRFRFQYIRSMIVYCFRLLKYLPIRHRIDRSHRRIVGAAQFVQQTVDRRPLERIVQRRRTRRTIAVRTLRRWHHLVQSAAGSVTGAAQVLEQRIEFGQIAGRSDDIVLLLLLMMVLGSLRARQRVVRRDGSRRGADVSGGPIEDRRRWLAVVGQRLVEGLRVGYDMLDIGLLMNYNAIAALTDCGAAFGRSEP